MNFDNVKTTITAYPKIFPDVLFNYVTEAPADGKTYGRKDRKWVDIRPSHISFFYGTTDTFNLKEEDLLLLTKYTPELEFKDQSINIGVKTSYPTIGGDVKGGSVVWFCASVPISTITQRDIGNWPIDYLPQVGVLTLDGVQYYCYHTSTALVPNDWRFTVTFDVDVIEGGSCK